MERLTERIANGQAVLVRGDEGDRLRLAGQSLDRLADYEDTGLEPECIDLLKQIVKIFHCDPEDPAQLRALLFRLLDIREKGRAERGHPPVEVEALDQPLTERHE